MRLPAYLHFAAGHGRLLSFGFLATFASSFGQTYFIGVFGPAIQADLGLGHTAWGTAYMVGTLASAAVLPWTGKQIDRLDRAFGRKPVALADIVAIGDHAAGIDAAFDPELFRGCRGEL